MQTIGRITDWHEGQQKYSVVKNNKAKEKQMEAEVEQANEDLKTLRNKRLKELYEKEMKEFKAKTEGDSDGAKEETKDEEEED